MPLVLEGSRLGGVIISRELERRFGIGERSGASFFSSSGPEVGGLCGRSSALSRQRVEGEPARHQCLEAAEETFASLEFWIREALFMPDSISRPVDLLAIVPANPSTCLGSFKPLACFSPNGRGPTWSARSAITPSRFSDLGVGSRGRKLAALLGAENAAKIEQILQSGSWKQRNPVRYRSIDRVSKFV